MQDKIDHIVVLMLENRSLDNVLGWLYADEQPQRFVGGDTTPIYQGLQTGSYSNEYGGRVIPAARGTTGASGHDGVAPQPMRVPGFDPGEEYAHVNQQLFGSPSRPTTTNPPVGTPAAMAGFAYDYDASYESWDQLDQIMEAYTPAQLPILNGLAKAYAVSDAWYASVPTQTNPNRAFSLCGTSLGRVDNTWDAVEQFSTHTIWNALPAGTSWGIYYQDIWHSGQCYTQYTFPRCNDALADGEIESIATFCSKARDGALPRFTYLEPKWGYGKGKIDGSGFYCGKFAGKIFGAQGNDYHPPTWVGPGEVFVNQVYEALTANAEAWQRTLFIITFDEHGGSYDHVDPGWGAVPPDAYRGPDGFGFDRYGVRVPTLLVSPWVSAGTVFRSPSSTLKFDHTSILATLLTWCGVAPGAAGLGDRVAVAPTFEAALAERARSDLPTFTVPDGYADQGKDCWITNEAERLPVGVVRSLVAQSATVEELEARARTELDRS
ncbi:MAG: alkaline phosphatase family protein [Actinomycetota bacterium]